MGAVMRLADSARSRAKGAEASRALDGRGWGLYLVAAVALTPFVSGVGGTPLAWPDLLNLAALAVFAAVVLVRRIRLEVTSRALEMATARATIPVAERNLEAAGSFDEGLAETERAIAMDPLSPILATSHADVSPKLSTLAVGTPREGAEGEEGGEPSNPQLPPSRRIRCAGSVRPRWRSTDLSTRRVGGPP